MKLFLILLTLFFSSATIADELDRLPLNSARTNLNTTISRKILQQRGLQLTGWGGERDPEHSGKLRKLNYTFRMNRQVDQDQARELLLSTMEDVLEIMNASGYCHTSMSKFPCDASSIWICISFYDSDGNSCYEPAIFSAYATQSDVMYRTRASDNETSVGKQIHETLHEATCRFRAQGS